MNSTAGLLAKLSESVENELRLRLKGFLGGMVRAYLPQTWVFRTEEGAASLLVDRDGHASVVPAAAPDPDVTVEGPHDDLKAVLGRARPGSAAPRTLKVTPHTSKGRTAFDYLRGRLGM